MHIGVPFFAKDSAEKNFILEKLAELLFESKIFRAVYRSVTLMSLPYVLIFSIFQGSEHKLFQVSVYNLDKWKI